MGVYDTASPQRNLAQAGPIGDERVEVRVAAEVWPTMSAHLPPAIL
jgi:hypothetical protein